MNIELLQKLLIAAMTSSVIACAFIQKTKGMFKSSKWVAVYSFIINIIIGIAYCLTFTEISLINSAWVGVFSYLGADTLYKALEGKLKPYSELIPKEEAEEIERDEK